MTRFRDWLTGLIQGTGSMHLEDLDVKELTRLEDIEMVLEASLQGPVCIFKHSTVCPVSASAYRRVTQWLEDTGSDAPACFLVKVIESRPVSNEIAACLGVTHQSPQFIIVNHREAVWNASHGAITGTAVSAALRDIAQ